MVEQAYHDYGPLFDSMHGARWLLSSSPVTITTNPTLENTAAVRDLVSVEVCKAGDPSQAWSLSGDAGDATDEIKLHRSATDDTCLGLWCCGCKACCGPACTEPEESAQAAANACHPQDKSPDHWNQQWAVGAGGVVTEKKSGKYELQ